ncbi:F0F1 ATP synthase subunit B [uncultured Ruthenibacterium sp.]|uniref:F0F1 ATP synthase subunit B n=1 Tax=uncultured Ruthenibacterium sp. TaxID=1905347 RepID=UPI00349E8DD6
MEYQSLVGVVPWTFVAQICNLFLQAFLFKKFLFKPIKEIMHKRMQQVDDNYGAAEQANKDAQALKDEYEQRLASAKQEAGEIVKAANVRAGAQAEQLVNQAREEAAALKAKAEKDIEMERRKAAGELKNDISALALDLAGKVVEREIDSKEHQELIDRFIDRVGDPS